MQRLMVWTPLVGGQCRRADVVSIAVGVVECLDTSATSHAASAAGLQRGRKAASLAGLDDGGAVLGDGLGGLGPARSSSVSVPSANTRLGSA